MLLLIGAKTDENQRMYNEKEIEEATWREDRHTKIGIISYWFGGPWNKYRIWVLWWLLTVWDSSSAALGISQASIISNVSRLNDPSLIFSSMLWHMLVRAFTLQYSTNFFEYCPISGFHSASNPSTNESSEAFTCLQEFQDAQVNVLYCNYMLISNQVLAKCFPLLTNPIMCPTNLEKKIPITW